MIYFFHGLESGPEGSKYRALREKHLVKTIDFRSPEEVDLISRNDLAGVAKIRLERALQETAPDEEIVVVGSSMGGLVAYLLEQTGLRKVRGLVLCAPALLRAEKILRTSCPTVVIHGTEDELLPFSETRQIALDIGAEFVEVRDNHRLAGSMEEILQALDQVLER